MAVTFPNAVSTTNTRRLNADTQATPGQPSIQPAVLRQGDRFEVAQAQATRGQPSAAEREVATKIGNLVNSRYGGDWQRAFRAYAGADGQVTKEGVTRMLADAGVGGLLMPRGIVADRLMEKFDVNRSGKIDFNEFRTGMNNLGFRV